MTWRVGAAASPASGQAMAEYYSPARRSRTRPKPPSITPAAPHAKSAQPASEGAVLDGHLAAGGTVAELRSDLAPALAAWLGITDPGRR